MLSRVFLLSSLLLAAATARAEGEVRVGVLSVLSGDLGVLGKNVALTVETYQRHYLRHSLRFSVEDSKLTSSEGLSAFQKLVNADRVQLIIAGCSTNGLVAAKALINSSQTPTISVVTGGRSTDEAGPYVFRIGNSDSLNGRLEAERFAAEKLFRVALFTEDTEYTHDISSAFLPRFSELEGMLVFNDTFSPGTRDFRSQVALIKSKQPQAVFMPTQTGVALGIFLKQWRELGGGQIPIHTSFVAAPNPDAHAIAGSAIIGVEFMSPAYDAGNPEWSRFLAFYHKDHGIDPAIAFHSAATLDALNLLQAYLDGVNKFDREGFRDHLLEKVKNYRGLMGTYSFDEGGNANTGFVPSVIEKSMSGALR
jgi:branched-chain amino acid transport system substrate-binding protein